MPAIRSVAADTGTFMDGYTGQSPSDGFLRIPAFVHLLCGDQDNSPWEKQATGSAFVMLSLG